MKITMLGWMAVITLGSAVAFAPMAMADGKQEEKSEAKAKPVARKGAARDRMKNIAEELKLTEEQKTKLKPILKEEGEKLKELRQNTGLSREDRRAKLKEVRESVAGKVKPILTNEQWGKWEKLRAEGPKRRTQQ